MSFFFSFFMKDTYNDILISPFFIVILRSVQGFAIIAQTIEHDLGSWFCIWDLLFLCGLSCSIRMWESDRRAACSLLQLLGQYTCCPYLRLKDSVLILPSLVKMNKLVEIGTMAYVSKWDIWSLLSRFLVLLILQLECIPIHSLKRANRFCHLETILLHNP